MTFILLVQIKWTPEDFAQLLSKRQGTFSSYFVQIDPNGGSLKTLFRKYGTYYDTGSIPFTPNDWHLLAASHDGEKISAYLDGKLIYETIQNDPIFVEEGSLGIGGTADGGSLFNGWIDDLRIYGKALVRKIFKMLGRMEMATLGLHLTFRHWIDPHLLCQ